jgi:hypothetical protein
LQEPLQTKDKMLSPHTLFILVDGVGLPPGPLTASAYAACPTLCRLFEDHCVPVDAGLGLPGIPQSATGQTTIFTGVNAGELLGAHLEGFPNPRLRQLIEKHNLFSALLEQGRTCTFANAYVRQPGVDLPLHLRSVTTVATLAALGTTRNRNELLADQAVFHDITRHTLVKHGITDIPTVSEETAAGHLLEVMRTVDFCLFEYFLTDHAGHRGTAADQAAVLASLDRFLAAVLLGLRPATELLLIISDHGNIEEGEHRRHTLNPVPWIACGRDEAEARRDCRKLTDVMPALLRAVCAG